MERFDDDPGDRKSAGESCGAGSMHAWKLVLAYDGTDFHGWQVQPGLRTIQGELASAVYRVTGERVLPQGSGRTDAGVHAAGQAVSLHLQAAIPSGRLRAALNRRLPSAIRVLEAEPAHAAFHARAGVASKRYEYRIFSRRRSGSGAAARDAILMPWDSRFVWECPFPLDAIRMQAAAAMVVGTFDFSSFAACNPDRAARLAESASRARTDVEAAAATNVRTIFSSEWVERDGLLLYRVSGSGFLHHMVRNLVGTFAEVGWGRRAATSIPEVIAARNRRWAGPTAPPQGLFLVGVDYRPDPEGAIGDTMGVPRNKAVVGCG